MDIEPEQCWNLDSFVGPRCAGNAHRVQLYRNRWPETPTRYDEAITVDLKLDGPPNNSVAARFSVRGHWIRRCGSGNVAAAYVLQQELGLSDVHLKTSCEQLRLLHRQGRFGYLTLPPALTPANCTTLNRVWAGTGQHTSTAPAPVTVECFSAGTAQDYWVTVLANPEQVAQLQPNLTALAKATERALIVTAQSSAPGVDFVLRYFAPQYGVTEDAATGSANAVLANYWAQRLNKTELCSRQLSAEGGEFYLLLEANSPALTLQNPWPVGIYGQAKRH